MILIIIIFFFLGGAHFYPNHPWRESGSVGWEKILTFLKIPLGGSLKPCFLILPRPLPSLPLLAPDPNSRQTSSRVGNKVVQICIGVEKVFFYQQPAAHQPFKCDTNKVHCYVLQLIFQSNKAVVTSQTWTSHYFQSTFYLPLNTNLIGPKQTILPERNQKIWKSSINDNQRIKIIFMKWFTKFVHLVPAKITRSGYQALSTQSLCVKAE